MAALVYTRSLAGLLGTHVKKQMHPDVTALHRSVYGETA